MAGVLIFLATCTLVCVWFGFFNYRVYDFDSDCDSLLNHLLLPACYTLAFVFAVYLMIQGFKLL